MSFQVPTVDISAYVETGSANSREALAAAVDKACTEVGFMQIIGHGISPAVRPSWKDTLRGLLQLGQSNPAGGLNKDRDPFKKSGNLLKQTEPSLKSHTIV